MKNTSKFQFITTVLLMTLLLFIGIANAAGNMDIRQLKEAQQLDKINPAGKNVFMNFKKSIIEESFIKKLESVSQIESFINDVALSGLSLYNVPKLSKSLANKIKQFVISGNIKPAKGDELVRKLKGIQHSNLKRDILQLCANCAGECDLEKFLIANIVNSYETGAISANDNTNKLFSKSQDAIVQNDQTNMVQSFDVCLPEINRLITKIPDVKSCKCDNEECYFTYSALYLEYLFLKKYMTIQKGYFLLKNGRYSEAETYFRSQTTPSTVAVAKISLAAEKKAMVKWNEEVIRIMITHFIGRCLYEQGKYSEALKYFNNSTILKIPQPPTILYGDYNDTITMFDRYPYSGLYSDFSIYDNSATKGIKKGFFWIWQGYYFSGIANYKLGNKKDALAFLKAYIASPDKEFENEAKKLISELETEPNIPGPIEIKEINVFLVSNIQTPVAWDQIIKVKDVILIQAKGQGLDLNHSETVNCKLYSSVTNSAGIDLILAETGANTNIFEAKYKIDPNMVEITRDKYKSITSVDASDLGIADDSDIFDSNTFIQSKVIMGSARLFPIQGKNPTSSSEYIKNAGCEILTILCQKQSTSILVRNQADWLYFSGHGNHKDGKLKTSSGKMDIGPEDISATKEWDEDLDIVIIAGCSVLDYNDYNNYYWWWKETNPGIMWKKAAPNVKNWLGYNYSAPKSPGDKKIIKDFFTYLSQQNNYTESWLKANRDNRACNACAIDSQGYWYIKYGGWTRLNNWYRSTPYPITGPIQL